MWKMIVADDERVIRNGLKLLLDWDALDIEIVGEAASGTELLAQIREKNPQVVLTDIRMPGMSGLEVIERCQGMSPAPRFIFVSGYEEFSYAKDAMRFGAVDYLLKPVTEEELAGAVKKAIRQLEADQAADMFREEKNELQQAFQDMNAGFEYTEEDLYQRFARANLSVEGCLYVGVCFSLIEDEELREMMGYEQRELLRFGVYNRIMGELRSRRLGFLVKKAEDICDAIVVIKREQREGFIEETLLPIWGKLQEELRVRLCMGIGEPVEQITQWQMSCKTARFACELYYFDEEPVIDFTKVYREYTVSFEDFHLIFETVFQQIAARDPEALSTIERELAAIEAIHYGNRYAAVNRVLIFTGTLLERLMAVRLVEGDFAMMQNELQESIRYLGTYGQVRRWLMEYYRGLLAGIFAEENRRSSGEMVSVQRYIREHYNQELSLKELAEVACVSPTYFSALFKKETGVNYKAYVTKIRMEEAIRLTLGTDMKTYEIAEAVGYNNVRRFVDAFKGIYKISPMDYRKANRKK